MRLVTNNPMEYLAWVGISIGAIGVLFGIAFLVLYIKDRNK
jgi:hypothetical protein